MSNCHICGKITDHVDKHGYPTCEECHERYGDYWFALSK